MNINPISSSTFNSSLPNEERDPHMLDIKPDETFDDAAPLDEATDTKLAPYGLREGMNAYIELKNGRVMLGRIHNVFGTSFEIGVHSEAIDATEIVSAREV